MGAATEVLFSSSQAMRPKRDRAVDVARGMAMTLVVLGHNTAFSQWQPNAVKFIFLFHVPAFFFLSGYVFNPETATLVKLARRLLIPFAVFSILFALAKLVARNGDVLGAAASVIWSTGATLPTSQLWFLPTLFLALLVARIVLQAWGRLGSTAVVALTMFVLVSLAYFALHIWTPPFEYLRWPSGKGPIGWPWSIEIVPIALVFCLSGYLLKEAGILHRIPLWYLAVMFSVVIVAYLLGARVDLNLRLMSPYMLALMAALGGSLAIMIAGRSIAKIGAGRDLMETIGQHTLVILAFHVTFQNAALAIIRPLASSHGIPGSVWLPSAVVIGTTFAIIGSIAVSAGYQRGIGLFVTWRGR